MNSTPAIALNHRIPSHSLNQKKHLPFYALFEQKIKDLSSQLSVVNQNFLYRHFENHRYSLLTSLPARLLGGCLTIPLLPLCMLSTKVAIAHRRFALYMNSDSRLAPLVRTINMPNVSIEKYAALVARGFIGVCSGAALYFNHLFLNSERSRGEIIQIAQQFVLGAPQEAVDLHLSTMDPQKLYEDNAPHLLTLIPKTDESTLKQGHVMYQNRDALLHLENGPYVMRINLGRGTGDYHALSLIKISDQEMYVFDPSHGLFEFIGADIPRQINDFFGKAYKTLYKYHIACYNRKKSHVTNRLLTPANFNNFHVMILPCFQNSLMSDSPEPKKGVDAWVKTPRTCGEYLHHLLFEEVVDRMKSCF